MKRRNAFRIVIAAAAILLVMGVESIVDPNIASAQGTCTAKAWIGGATCTITCPVGFTPECKAGLFSASCRCVPIPPPPRRWRIRIVIEFEISCAIQLRDFLFAQGSEEATHLGLAVQNCTDAIQSGDEDWYSDAENQFVDVSEDISEDLRAQIAAFLAETGCGSLD